MIGEDGTEKECFKLITKDMTPMTDPGENGCDGGPIVCNNTNSFL